MNKYKDEENRLFIIIILTLLGMLIFVVPSIVISLVIFVLSNFKVLGMNFDSYTNIFWFSIGSCFYFLVAFPIGFIVEVILKFLNMNHIIRKTLDETIQFFMFLTYLYILDLFIEGVSFSLYVLLSITLFYCVLYSMLENLEGPWDRYKK